MIRWLKWFFVSNGVVATDKRSKIVSLRLGGHIVVIRSPFKHYWPNGPTAQALTYYSFLHQHPVYFRCKACGAGVWGYKQHEYCGSWKCYKELGI